MARFETNAFRLPVPGLRLGAYPQRFRNGAPSDLMEGLWRRFSALAAPRPARHLAAAWRIAQRMANQPPDWQTCQALAQTLRRRGLNAARREEALACCAALAARSLGLQAHLPQLAAADALLCGRFAEMATGEGKTLAIGLAAAVAALAGSPVHVVTANDYLAARDAAEMTPLFAALGLRAACVLSGDAPAARRLAYGAGIVYVTARELVFDYLQDSVRAPFEADPRAERLLSLSQLGPARQRLLPGLCVAIIDEADSVLIDEARLPLILARPQAEAAGEEVLARTLALARQMTAEEHFSLVAGEITLAPGGQAWFARHAADLPENHRRPAEARLCQALSALHLYVRDRHYVVRDGQVQIVDEQTGRLARQRSWSRELHRFIELKEGSPLGREHETAAQLTYQRFFPRYHLLAGVSGTLAECAAELAVVYDRRAVRLPTHRPVRRRLWPGRVFADRQAMWQACLERIRVLAPAGRPVLIGTDSVRDSRALSACLGAAGVPHQILDALQDAEEAAIVAQAGQAGQVTVATRMAGRGTDIRLDEAARAAGGLHVICCQHNSTARTDRQLIGRTGRQGDPGSAEHFHALDADNIDQWLPASVRKFILLHHQRLPQRLLAAIFRFGQGVLARREQRLRQGLLRAEHQMHRLNAYRGPGF